MKFYNNCPFSFLNYSQGDSKQEISQELYFSFIYIYQLGTGGCTPEPVTGSRSLRENLQTKHSKVIKYLEGLKKPTHHDLIHRPSGFRPSTTLKCKLCAIVKKTREDIRNATIFRIHIQIKAECSCVLIGCVFVFILSNYILSNNGVCLNHTFCYYHDKKAPHNIEWLIILHSN